MWRQCFLERYTKLESEVVDALDVVCAVPVRAEAVVGSKLESEIICIKRIVDESEL